jgi:hypothetical protein
MIENVFGTFLSEPELFIEVPRIEILRPSPLRSSKKFATSSNALATAKIVYLGDMPPLIGAYDTHVTDKRDAVSPALLDKG